MEVCGFVLGICVTGAVGVLHHKVTLCGLPCGGCHCGVHMEMLLTVWLFPSFSSSSSSSSPSLSHISCVDVVLVQRVRLEVRLQCDEVVCVCVCVCLCSAGAVCEGAV